MGIVNRVMCEVIGAGVVAVLAAAGAWAARRSS